MNLRKITAIVTTQNEEVNIARCLDSLKGVGELIIVDSFSTDKTREIARRYPALIYERPYASAAKQKNWAIDLARSEWILILDADEQLSAELKQEIGALEVDPGVNGYWIRRQNEYLGSRITHCGWQRDKVLRLFRSGMGRYEERELHEEIELKGKEGFLMGKILHNPYKNMSHYLQKMEEYSKRGAQDYLKRGGRFPFVNLVLHPPFRFIRMYLLQRGFLDGYPGLKLCLFSSYGVMLKYAKARRIKNWQKKSSEASASSVAS
jgi:glycosyltransferase involved in cell wall biosynthesis